VYSRCTERELTVANRISKMVPAAELVRFSNSGTEAVMAGLRVARAYHGQGRLHHSRRRLPRPV
jgi:glutamate-1-semialdehyde 2,1-aminomutase